MNRRFLMITVVSLAVIAVSGLVSRASLRVLAVRPSSGIPAARDAVADSLPPVRVAVLNGCGRPGIAADFVRKLRTDGLDVVNGLGGNADSFGFDRSVVIDRRGKGEHAAKAARSLGIRDVVMQRSENPYMIEDVVVVIGRDWDTLLPYTENRD